MLRPAVTQSPPTAPASSRRPRPTRSLSATSPRTVSRRPSVSGLTLTGAINPVTGAPKAQRTSKTTQKLVLLPSAPQTKPLPLEVEDEEALHGYETDRGVREQKSAAERMSKEQRENAGFSRMTAYCVAESFKMKLLTSFLKREHNVSPRIFDEAMYVMYHLPLLPGYGPHSNMRSSAPPASPGAEDLTSGLSEAEEDGYQGMYFDSASETGVMPAMEGYILSTSPVVAGTDLPLEGTANATREPENGHGRLKRKRREKKSQDKMGNGSRAEDYAEAIFFSYGVVVFYGLTESQERGILEDVEAAGVMRRKLMQDDWEVEECHYAVGPTLHSQRQAYSIGASSIGASVADETYSTIRTSHTPAYTTTSSVRISTSYICPSSRLVLQLMTLSSV
ncbi:hypothetical protein AcV5_002569 [Taiwanofungus camphoratus]|nr:hypothetical protein AcV5_002569 [Antrodia cinnamomea]